MTFSLEEDEDVVVIGAQVCVMSDDGWDDESLTLDHQQRTGRETTSGWMKSCIRIMEDECILNTTRRCPSNGNKETREKYQRKKREEDRRNEWEEGQSSSQLLEREAQRETQQEKESTGHAKNLLVRKRFPKPSFGLLVRSKNRRETRSIKKSSKNASVAATFPFPFPVSRLEEGFEEGMQSVCAQTSEKKRTRRKDNIFKGNRVTILYRIEGYQVL